MRPQALERLGVSVNALEKAVVTKFPGRKEMGNVHANHSSIVAYFLPSGEVNLMRIGRIGWLVLLLCVSTSSALAARLPNRLDDIPVFPGAVRDPELEQVHRESSYYDETVVFSDVRAYTVNAIVDDVLRFYLDYTQATEGWPELDAADLEPGETLGPWYSSRFTHTGSLNTVWITGV